MIWHVACVQKCAEIFYSLLQWLAPELHKQPDGSGRCVKLRHSMLLYDLPNPAHMRVDWNAFKLPQVHMHTCLIIYTNHIIMKSTKPTWSKEYRQNKARLKDLPAHWSPHWLMDRTWCRSGLWSSQCLLCTSTHRHGDNQRHIWM